LHREKNILDHFC